MRPDLRQLVYEATGERPKLQPTKRKRPAHLLVCRCWACREREKQR